jgi:hypothetical protein
LADGDGVSVSSVGSSGLSALMNTMAGGDADALSMLMLKKAMDQSAGEAQSLVSTMMPATPGPVGGTLDMRL